MTKTEQKTKKARKSAKKAQKAQTAIAQKAQSADAQSADAQSAEKKAQELKARLDAEYYDAQVKLAKEKRKVPKTDTKAYFMHVIMCACAKIKLVEAQKSGAKKPQTIAFTWGDILDLFGGFSGKTRTQAYYALCGKNGKFPDGPACSGAYSLTCIASGTMRGDESKPNKYAKGFGFFLRSQSTVTYNPSNDSSTGCYFVDRNLLNSADRDDAIDFPKDTVKRAVESMLTA